eukprot:13190569-Alexandrium_andersonii.AAC.1
MWECVRTTFDEALSLHFEKDFASGKLALNFVKAHRPQLGLFLQAEDLEHMKQEVLISPKDPFPSVCRRVLSSSRVGAALFAECGASLGYGELVQSLNNRLGDMENQDFNEEEAQSFLTLARRDIQVLVEGVHKQTDKRDVPIDFVGCTWNLTAFSLFDEMELRLMARVKQVSMNSGKLSLLPWESAMWEAGAIPNTRSACPVPGSLLGDFENCRDAVQLTLDEGHQTIGEMKRAVAPQVKTLLALDKTFVL